jgi:hypothetical protein
MTILMALSKSAELIVPDLGFVILRSRSEVPYASGGETVLPVYSKFLGPLLINVRPSRPCRPSRPSRCLSWVNLGGRSFPFLGLGGLGSKRPLRASNPPTTCVFPSRSALRCDFRNLVAFGPGSPFWPNSAGDAKAHTLLVLENSLIVPTTLRTDMVYMSAARHYEHSYSYSYRLDLKSQFTNRTLY